LTNPELDYVGTAAFGCPSPEGRLFGAHRCMNAVAITAQYVISE
jgi:hypothetical protein